MTSTKPLKRVPLPSDISRCTGDLGAHRLSICATCARYEQLRHDDAGYWFPRMDLRPKDNGTCVYWIKETYR